MASYLLVVNPSAGRGQAPQQATALFQGLPKQCQVEIVTTRYRGGATDIATAMAGKVDRIIAVGGDGTLNEVLAGLIHSGYSCQRLPELGYLPAGTANAAARAFGFNPDPKFVASALPAAVSRPVDVGMVEHAGGERPFLLWLGAGYDAVIIKALNAARTGRMGITGLMQGVPRILRDIYAYGALPIAIEVDGVAQGLFASAFLANVSEVAFRGVVAEKANAFDGRLDVVAVPPGPPRRHIRQALTMLTKGLARAKGVHHLLGSHIRLAAEGSVPFQLDGEPVGTLPVTVRLAAGRVRLLHW